MSGCNSELVRLFTRRSRIRQRIVISELDKHDLFLYKKQVWRSLGKLLPESHSVTAQRVAVNQHGCEVCLENADFTEHLLVEPYKGDVPSIKQGAEHHSYSEYYLSKQK